MVLPIFGLLALVAVIGVLFFVGVSRYNVNASLGFIVLASVLMLTTSMFVMNEGIQLDNVGSIDPVTLEYSYQTVDYDINSWNWLRVVTDIMFWGGFVAIIFGIAFNYKRTTSRTNNEWAI